jgi:hypothetical protein
VRWLLCWPKKISSSPRPSRMQIRTRYFTRFNRGRSPLPAARNSSAGVSPAVRAASSPPSPSTKFLFRRRLLPSHTTRKDLGSEITFTFHWLETLAAKRHKNAAHGASRAYTTMQWVPCGAKGRRPPNGLIELSLRRRLLGPNATSSNLGSKITFTFHGSPRHPPQHRDLPNVR